MLYKTQIKTNPNPFGIMPMNTNIQFKTERGIDSYIPSIGINTKNVLFFGLEFSQKELAEGQFAESVKIYSAQCLLYFGFLSEFHLFYHLNRSPLHFLYFDTSFQVLPYSDVPMQPIVLFVQLPAIKLHIP